MDVDRHYITPGGLNMLLYIPDSDGGRMHYLSMHVELFNRHTAPLFPRMRIFLRSSQAAAAAEHKKREEAAIPGKREDGLPSPPSARAAKYLLSVAKNALPEGRLGLEEEMDTLAFVGAYLPDLADDPAAIRDFIAAVALFEDSFDQYRALGYTDTIAGKADHGFLAFAQVAASLLRVGEYQEAVKFFERARNAAGDSLERDDPFGYAAFTGDYSDALAAAGETRKARRFWDEAQKAMAKASGTRQKYIGIRSLIVKDDIAFELKDNKEEQKFTSDDGSLVVTAQEDNSKYIGPQKVKYLDMRFHSLDGAYTIIEISRKSRQYDRCRYSTRWNMALTE